MPEHMMRQSDDSADQDEARDKNRIRERLNSLAETLLRKRDEAVMFRSSSGIERIWREDEQAFDTLDESDRNSMIDYATGQATSRGTTGPIRSRVAVNILRSKCEVAEGRFSDILLPVDDKNYGMKVTPVADLVKALTDIRKPIDTTTGQPVTDSEGKPVKTSDIARAKMDKAEKAMTGMEDEIDDQLTECGFNGQCRLVIEDAVRVGTGVLKGPNVVKQIRKIWIPKEDESGIAHTVKVVEDPTPMSRRVDYWNCYPDPQCGEEISRASYMWEYDEILPRELRSLIGVEGYFSDQIEAILREEPQRTQAVYSNKDKKSEIKRQKANKGSAYEKWEYHGDVNRDDLEALGVAVEDLKGSSLSACVVFVNERPIKVQLNILDTGDIPYDVFQWCKVKQSIWGIGIVRIGTWAQRVIQAAWRSTMDNGRDSSGANVIIGQGVEPVDSRWEVTGKKLWRLTGEMDDVRKAFAQFQIETRQPELQAIIEMALRFLDMETAIPMLFQGEQQEQPETLGATNIMVDSNNVTLRSRVKRWDDQITRPHITRYYHWNMQYNENPEIKGDYNVDPRGTSVLLARDQQARTLVQLMALRGDPRVDAEVDWGKAVRELFTSLRLNVLKSEEDKAKEKEAQESQQPQQDPHIQATQIRTQGEMAKAELNQASDMRELEFKAQEAERERQHDREMRNMEFQIKMMEFAQESGLSLQEIKADLAKEAAKISLQRELTDKKMKGPQVATPLVEPPGRADEGRAFPD
jgi:hypothetical protein